MSTVITEEADLFIRSVGYGVFLGACYEMLHRIVGGLFWRTWWRGLEDLLYWTVCALVLFSMIWDANGGVIRWYALVGAAVGGWIYHIGIRPALHRIFRPLWKSARNTKRFVEKLLKKKKESVTLIDKVENGPSGAGRGRRHGRIR